MPDNNAVTLRKTEPSDYPLFARWWNNPSVADGCRKTLDETTDDEAERLFHEWSDVDDDTRFGRTVLDPFGNPIGFVSAWDGGEPDRDPTMSVLIGPYYQDRGFGNQAMKLGITLAAEQLKAKKITVKVWSFNLRARHMVESLGFVEVDRHEGVVERGGRTFGEVVYQAPIARLTGRITAEAAEREEGEKLEAQRFAAERPSDLMPVR
ncbi:GNAT family N-acetyltransferase [Bifidobacterium stellenboschense]|uniref:GNAT family acetyltransferase n=1 Tax=Bifidobacterium stellenboschense TaxID=762211 RepID=A0A087DZK0_9BIFI|nr:GNAT family N-acetyltransferase [Bifidobacterium stellenboschense]KFJ00951.1 GNAT family acetyltransferase [Bifidobacterium stellenboschense]